MNNFYSYNRCCSFRKGKFREWTFTIDLGNSFFPADEMAFESNPTSRVMNCAYYTDRR